MKRIKHNIVAHKPLSFYNEENIVIELEKINKNIGHFPSKQELTDSGNYYLITATKKFGGINYFRKLMGYDYLHAPVGYWTDEVITSELESITDKIGHFPSQTKLNKVGIRGLVQAINVHGGLIRFRKLLKYDFIQQPRGYWTKEQTIKEIEIIEKLIGHIPTIVELINMNKQGLRGAINKHGGITKLRELMNKDYLYKPDGYWTVETTIQHLKPIEKDIGHFPTQKELTEMDRIDLIGAIRSNGGVNKFRELLGYQPFRKPNGYWNDETILKEIEMIQKSIGHFPYGVELSNMGKSGLVYAINNNGGSNKFRELLGYTVSMQEKYKSESSSYSNKRGKKSEKIVKRIITDYCKINIFASPSYNVKLSKGNIIEFVCNTGKRIGIDVTNTEIKETVYRKWRKKDYYKYLDELWIVVFSDVYDKDDYIKWNQKSPDNVKVMSIHQFLEELDYSIDEHLKQTIDKYCACTFHTKDEFIKKNTL